MPEKTIRIPDADHPIAIARNPGRVVVRFGGRVIADTTEALTLREAQYPPVIYIPRDAVDPRFLEPSDRTSYCPYKGDASYFSLIVDGRRSQDAIWSYERPFPAVAEIAGHLAFYPDRVDAIEERAV